MDLSALGSSLPLGLAEAEREMGDKFRAAALSMTTLYKASLGATKQAYSVGYSSALSDVLATVHSSVTAGQDPSIALSRLMDWAEARQIAMAAFASDEGEEMPLEIPRTKVVRPTTGGTGRSNSVPVDTNHLQPLSSSSATPLIHAHTLPTPSSHTHIQAQTQTQTHGRHRQTSVEADHPSSSQLPSSPPSAISTRFLPTRPSKNIPIKYNPTASSSSSATTGSSSRSLPSTSFNPILPFSDTLSSGAGAGAGTTQSLGSSIGNKRPIDDQMEDVISAHGPVSLAAGVGVPVGVGVSGINGCGGGGGGGVGTVGTLLNPNVRGRSAKRRSVGVGKEDKEEERERERRRAGRRH